MKTIKKLFFILPPLDFERLIAIEIIKPGLKFSFTFYFKKSEGEF